MTRATQQAEHFVSWLVEHVKGDPAVHAQARRCRIGIMDALARLSAVCSSAQRLVRAQEEYAVHYACMTRREFVEQFRFYEGAGENLADAYVALDGALRRAMEKPTE